MVHRGIPAWIFNRVSIYLYNDTIQRVYTMKTSEKIRESLLDLGPYASSREVYKHCEAKYGTKPSPQQIYEAVGSEKERRAETYNGRELMDVKKFCRQKFNGDFNRMNGALRVVISMEKNENPSQSS